MRRQEARPKEPKPRAPRRPGSGPSSAPSLKAPTPPTKSMVSVRSEDLRSWVVATLRSRNEAARADEAAKVNTNSNTVVEQLRAIAGKEAWHEATKIASRTAIAGFAPPPVAKPKPSRPAPRERRNNPSTAPANIRDAVGSTATGSQGGPSVVPSTSCGASAVAGAAGQLQAGLPAAGPPPIGRATGALPPPPPPGKAHVPSPSPEGRTGAGAGIGHIGSDSASHAGGQLPAVPIKMSEAAAAADRRVRQRLSAPSTFLRPVKDSNVRCAVMLADGMERWIGAALTATARVAASSASSSNPPVPPSATAGAAAAPNSPTTLAASSCAPMPASGLTLTSAHILRWLDSGGGMLPPPARWPSTARSRYQLEISCLSMAPQSDGTVVADASEAATTCESRKRKL